MGLKEKLGQDLKEAMKTGQSERLGVLRLVNAAIHGKEIEKRTKTGSSDLTEEEVIGVFSSEAKKRRESIEIFKKGGRSDLADKEQAELKIIQDYLPQLLGREEVEKEINKVLQEHPELSDFGLAMKEVMKILKGKADAKMISEILKMKLENK